MNLKPCLTNSYYNLMDNNKRFMYSFNSVLLVEHPKAIRADVLSEIEVVSLYSLNIMLNISSPMLFLIPIQNAASLMLSEILKYSYNYNYNKRNVLV